MKNVKTNNYEGRKKNDRNYETKCHGRTSRSCCETNQKEGLDVQVNQGKEQIVIGLKGDTRLIQDVAFRSYDGVEDAIRISNTYKLTSREFHPQDTVVDVDGVKIGDGHFVTMAGPCSIEGLEQIRECARIAKAGGAQILRGGAFKPRTSPYAFQGLEEEGLKYIRQAADETGMKVITEVMDEGHIDMVAEYSDILQIGARNMQNFKLLAAVGKTGKPIGLKRGISGTIDEWLNAAEYIAVQDKSEVIFIEREFEHTKQQRGIHSTLVLYRSSKS